MQVSIVDEWLARNGFKKTTRPGWTVWNFVGDKLGISEKNRKNSHEKKFFASSSIWKINQIEVTERKGQHQISNLSLSLDYSLLKRSVTQAAKKFYGARTTVTIVECDKGSFWVFLEFVKSAAKKTNRASVQPRPQSSDFMPYGVAGFKVGFGCSANAIEVYFSEFFGIGFVPQVFISSHMRIIHEALGLRKLAVHHEDIFERKSLFEFHLSQNVALLLLNGGDAVPKELLTQRNKQSSLSLAFNAGKVDFTYGQAEHPYEISNRSVVPLVVLESREGTDDLTEIDDLLVSGKISKACKKIVDYIQFGNSSPYLSRRLCLLALCGQEFPEHLSANSGSGAEVETKLYLSCVVRGAAIKGEMTKVLDSLSVLGRMLTSDLSDIESVKSFDLVIPELLGDAWLPASSHKADICYERILQRCGDLPRILRKMISIAETEENFTREFELCLRLSVVERRRNELAKVYFRLAELSKKFPANRGNPIDFAFKSLQNDRNFFQSAILAASLLNQENKPNEAIGLLDQMLSDPTVAIPQKARALLEFQVGVTWHQRLTRPDLAERRYERSLELDPANIEALVQMESICRSSGQTHKIGALLEQQFDAYERLADVNNLKRVFEELVELYRGPMDQPQKGYELYQRMLALAIVEPEEIDKLMSWRDIEIDWRSIYNTLVKNLANLPIGDLSARYHIRLAEICRDKMEDLAGTYNHYRAALDHGVIDASGFRMIVEKLASDQSYDQLASCFETRLKQVTGQERVDLVLEILSFPSVLSDTRRDQLAIEAFITDADQVFILFQRINYYQSMDNVDELARFAGAIVQLIKSPTKAGTWVRNVIESLQGCVDPTKYKVIDKLFRVLVTIDADPQGVLTEAINLFKETADAGRCSFYVRELLKFGEMPIELHAKKNATPNQTADEVAEQKIPLAMVSGEPIASRELDPVAAPEPRLSIAASFVIPDDAGLDTDANTVIYDSNAGAEPAIAIQEDYSIDLFGSDAAPQVVRGSVRSELHLVPEENQPSEDFNLDLGFSPGVQSWQPDPQMTAVESVSEPAISFSLADLSAISDPSESSGIPGSGIALNIDLDTAPDEGMSLDLQDPASEMDSQVPEQGMISLDLGGADGQLAFAPHPVGQSTGIPLPIDPGSMLADAATPGALKPEPPDKLDLELSSQNFAVDQEVSSIELAAALDLKAVLPEDEYSSPELRNSGSLLGELKSGLLPRSEDSMEGSIQKVSAGLEAGNPNSVEAVDWRSAILAGSVTEDLTETLMKQAFANEVEKHLALQCVALIAGNCQLLDAWHWRVWRSSKEYGYQLSGRERFNSEFTSPALQSQLHQFIIACNPLMAKVFRENYTIEHLAKIMGTSTQNIEKAKKQVSWQQGLLNDVGFHLYKDRIEKKGYKAFNLPGLGGNIFFEGPQKSVYFDEAHFQKQPPGVLFHRILSLLWSIRLQYYIPLALNPKKQVLPFLVELHQKLDIQGISKLTEKIKSKSPLSKHLASIDLRTLQSLKAKTGVPTEAQVSGLWFAMQEHIFKLILSETLDVVGLLEAILSKDLTVPGALKLKEILVKSPYTKSLLLFATKLVV